MNAQVVSVELPAKLYAELQSLAAEEQTDLVELITRLLTTAGHYRAWQQDLAALREQIRQDGGLQVSASRDEVIERLRETRRSIFEAEYAHLYR